VQLLQVNQEFRKEKKTKTKKDTWIVIDSKTVFGPEVYSIMNLIGQTKGYNELGAELSRTLLRVYYIHDVTTTIATCIQNEKNSFHFQSTSVWFQMHSTVSVGAYVKRHTGALN
jgi:hypothetical protein